jgi:hypothetical protein
MLILNNHNFRELAILGWFDWFGRLTFFCWHVNKLKDSAHRSHLKQ